MDKVDLKIYIAQLMNSFESSVDEIGSGYDAIRTDFGLDKSEYSDEMLKQSIMDELEIIAEENIIEYDDPTLSMDQFEKCIANASTRLVLEGMVKKGLIEVTFDAEQMDNVYKLTEEGLKEAKKII